MFQRAFSVSTREPAALLFAPGGHSPTGVFVAWCNVGTFVRLCFGVSCGIARARSFVCDHVRARRGRRDVAVVSRLSRRGRPSCRGRGVPGCGRGAARPWLRRPPSLCRRRVVATRRQMLVFAMVLMASHYPDLHNRFVVCIVIAIKQTTTERNGDEREATTTKPTAARTVTRSPPQ